MKVTGTGWEREQRLREWDGSRKASHGTRINKLFPCKTLVVTLVTIYKAEELTSFPGVVEQIERSVNPFPVLQVKERVRNTFTITALQNVLRRKYQRLRFQ